MPATTARTRSSLPQKATDDLGRGNLGGWLPKAAAYLPHAIKGFAPYLPSNAGGAVWGAGKLFGGQQLSPWAGFAVLCGYAVVLTGLAAWRLRRRDA